MSHTFHGSAARLTLVVSLALLAACQPRVYLMPTPTVIAESGADPFASNPELEESNEVPVLFATNRLPIGASEARDYTFIPSDDLRLGIAHLRIGSEQDDWASLYKLSTTGDAARRPLIVLERQEELGVIWAADDPASPTEAQEFFELVDLALERSLDKNLMVYIHGANNNVYRASAQAAQYRHFTGRNSVVLAFAWPSAESLFRYGTDVTNAARTAPVLARLIEALAANTRAERLNFLAYSAGAQVLAPALVELGKGLPGEPRQALRGRLRLGEVYFAAPDVDFKAFSQQLEGFADLPRSVTVSVNMNDFVLGLAEQHHGVSRLGRPNPEELSEEEALLLIDASRSAKLEMLEVSQETVPKLSGGSHGFWYEHPWVSSDVLLQFVLGLAPPERALQLNEGELGFVYWSFPTDYPERVSMILRRLKAQR